MAAALILLFTTNTEKPLPTFLKAVDAGIKDLMQKSFEQTKAALKDMPADQRDATCKAALDGLKGDMPLPLLLKIKPKRQKKLPKKRKTLR